MKNFKTPLSFLLLVILFFCGMYFYFRLAGAIPFSVTSTVTNQVDAFSVTGEGTAVAKPDIAMVSVGVEKNGLTPVEAQAQINTTISEVINRLKTLGIDTDRDVKTTSYNISPNYDWNAGGRRIIDYRASTNLSIKVRDISKLNEVIDQSTSAGANRIDNISFEIDDKEQLLNEARQQAVEQAKSKAQQAAKNAGFRLGKIVNYSESTQGDYYPLYSRDSLMVEDAAAPTEIQTGSTEIKLNVTLSFQIE